MPRTKSGEYDHKAYQNEYHKNMKTKLLSFNPNDSEDMTLWNHLMSKGTGNVTQYIKRLIRRDMVIEPKRYPPTRYSDETFGCSLCKHEVQKNAEICEYCGVRLHWEP